MVVSPETEPRRKAAVDMGGKSMTSSAAAYTLVVARKFGRIWSLKPEVQQDGLLTVLRGEHDQKQTRPIVRPRFTAVAFSLKAETLATVDNRGNVFLFHVTRNRYALLDWICHAGTAIAFGACNRAELYVAFEDGSVRVYNVKGDARQLLCTLKGHRCPVTHISTSRNGDQMVTVSPETVALWDMKTYMQLRSLGSGPYGSLQAEYSNDGDSLIVAFKDESIWLWDTYNLTHRATLRLPSVRPPTTGTPLLGTMALSSDQRWLLAAGALDPLLHCWDLRTLRYAFALVLPSPGLLSGACGATQLHFMPDNNTVAVLCTDGAVRFIDVAGGTVAYEIGGCIPPAQHFTIDARGNHACVISGDGEGMLYDLFTLRKKAAAAGAPGAPLKRLSLEELSSLRSGAVPSHAETDGLFAAYPGACMATLSAAPATQLFRQPRSWRAAPGHKAAAAAAPGGRSPAPTRPRITTPNGNQSARKPWGGGAQKTPSKSPAAAGPTPPSPGPGPLSRKDLRKLLDSYGSYPDKYRVIIWRFLLQLPGNTGAHALLSGAGTHPSFEALGTSYPLSNRALLSRLQRVASCLAHWSPVLGQVESAPAMAFPLVKVFGTDELAAFEALCTLVLNWASEWFVLFPDPPLPLLARLEGLLLHWDPELLEGLSRAPGGFQAAAWTLLQSLFSEVLSKQEWLKAFDHVFTNDARFLYFLLLSIVLSLKTKVLAAETPQELQTMFRRSHPTDLNKVIMEAYRLRRETPPELCPPGGPLKPLPPADQYPEFRGYNERAVDFQIAEQRRLAMEEQELLQRREVVRELQERTQTLATRQVELESQRGRLLQLETERRSAMRRQEEALAAEMRKLDDKSKEERLRQIDIIEASFRANLVSAQEQWNRELEILHLDIERKQEGAMETIQRRKEEEALKALEFQASQRMWAMQEEAQRGNVAERLQQEVAVKVAESEAAQRGRESAWEAEDKQDVIVRQHEAARRSRLTAAQEEARVRKSVETEMFRTQLEQELTVKQVEMERALRRTAEKEAAVTAEALEAERAREEGRRREEEELLKARSGADQAWFDTRAALRAERVQDKEQERKKEASTRAEQLEEAERASRIREAQEQLLERRRMLEKQNKAEERQASRLIDAMEEQRARDRAAVQDLRRSEAELEAKIAHTRRVVTEQLDVEEEEATHFDELRGQMALKRAEAEADQRRRHEELMMTLAVEREKAVLELDAAWRRNVARGEMTRLEAEAREVAEARREYQQAAVAEEMDAAREVTRLQRHAAAAAASRDPAVAAAEAAAGEGLHDSSSSSSGSSIHHQQGNRDTISRRRRFVGAGGVSERSSEISPDDISGVGRSFAEEEEEEDALLRTRSAGSLVAAAIDMADVFRIRDHGQSSPGRGVDTSGDTSGGMNASRAILRTMRGEGLGTMNSSSFEADEATATDDAATTSVMSYGRRSSRTTTTTAAAGRYSQSSSSVAVMTPSSLMMGAQRGRGSSSSAGGGSSPSLSTPAALAVAFSEAERARREEASSSRAFGGGGGSSSGASSPVSIGAALRAADDILRPHPPPPPRGGSPGSGDGAYSSMASPTLSTPGPNFDMPRLIQGLDINRSTPDGAADVSLSSVSSIPAGHYTMSFPADNSRAE